MHTGLPSLKERGEIERTQAANRQYLAIPRRLITSNLKGSTSHLRNKCSPLIGQIIMLCFRLLVSIPHSDLQLFIFAAIVQM